MSSELTTWLDYKAACEANDRAKDAVYHAYGTRDTQAAQERADDAFRAECAALARHEDAIRELRRETARQGGL